MQQKLLPFTAQDAYRLMGNWIIHKDNYKLDGAPTYDLILKIIPTGIYTLDSFYSYNELLDNYLLVWYTDMYKQVCPCGKHN